MPFTLFNQTRLKFNTLMTYFDKIIIYLVIYTDVVFLQSVDDLSRMTSFITNLKLIIRKIK